MDFSPYALLDALPALARSVWLNLALAAMAMALALIGATVLTVFRSFKQRWTNLAIDTVVSFIRGTPVLIQIFLFYYGLPALGIQLAPVTAGILALSFNSAIFIAEIMRGGLASMDPGPIEAGIALGLRPCVIWRKIVLPQLYLRILPPLISEATILVKGTALLSVITVVELFRTAQQIAATTFRPFETMIAAALVVLSVNLIISRFGHLVEVKLRSRMA